MELTEEEKEALAFFLSKNWIAFFESSTDFMSVVALHKLAAKFELTE
ncbi:hypothetical protein [Pantoea conspicua]|nr:hypothetical protein [Pantoea conspicua]